MFKKYNYCLVTETQILTPSNLLVSKLSDPIEVFN